MLFFATTSPLFHLSTPIIAQFKALNLLFQCTPHLCYPQFFHPSWHQFDFFLTTPLLVPPTKSQHFDSYLTQIFTLNSQIIVLSPKYPPAIFKIPKFTPFHPFLKLACQKLHTFISSNWIKNCPFFATTSPFFHLSTPIIAQFKALNLPFHCIPHFCYPQFFSPIVTPIWFFSTTPLLVPPSKSQFFYSYLNQFFILNSQITFIQSQRPFCPFPIPQIYPFSSLCKISMLKTVYLHFFKFESKALPFLPLLRHFFATHSFFHPYRDTNLIFFNRTVKLPMYIGKVESAILLKIRFSRYLSLMYPSWWASWPTLIPWSCARTYASVTSHSRAPYRLFPGCFEQKSYVHSRGPHGPRAAPYEFCLPVRGP